MEQKKMIGIAKVLCRIVQFVGILFAGLAVTCLILAAATGICGGNLYRDDGPLMKAALWISGNDGIVTKRDTIFLKVYSYGANFQEYPKAYMVYVIGGLIGEAFVYAMTVYGCVVVQKMITPMREGRPFEENVLSHLRKTAVIILAVNLTKILVHSMVNTATLMVRYPGQGLLETGKFDSVTTGILTADYTFVWVVGIILLLSYVFAHGQALQQEVDDLV